MTTYQTAFLSETKDELATIPAEKRAYFQERLRNRLYDLVAGEFLKRQAETPNFTQAALAKRIESRPDLVNRWLSSPGNWTLDTLSNLLLGIAGAELEIGVKHFDQPVRNFTRPEWLDCNPSMRDHDVFSPQPPVTGTSTFEPVPTQGTVSVVGVDQ